MQRLTFGVAPLHYRYHSTILQPQLIMAIFMSLEVIPAVKFQHQTPALGYSFTIHFQIDGRKVNLYQNPRVH